MEEIAAAGLFAHNRGCMERVRTVCRHRRHIVWQRRHGCLYSSQRYVHACSREGQPQYCAVTAAKVNVSRDDWAPELLGINFSSAAVLFDVAAVAVRSTAAHSFRATSCRKWRPPSHFQHITIQHWRFLSMYLPGSTQVSACCSVLRALGLKPKNSKPRQIQSGLAVHWPQIAHGMRRGCGKLFA